MKNNKVTIDVCVATFKRPQMIARNLLSLINQQLNDNVSMRIIVIDNDANGSAKQAVQEVSEQTDIEIIYDTETEQNIACARNKALTHVNAVYFACVDDDEQVGDDWLMKMLGAMEQYRADVVLGPVIEILPSNTQPWIVEGGFFKRENHETGTIMKHGGTGNVLIKKAIVDGQPFDKTFGLTGGSDTKLFHKLYQENKTLIWCKEAIAWEDVLPNRLNLKWLLMRAYRGGQVYIRVYSKYWSRPRLVYWYSTRIVYVFISLLAAVLFAPFKKSKSVFYLRKLMANIGQLTGNMGFNYKEYKK